MIDWYWPLCGIAMGVSILSYILLALLVSLHQWHLQTMKVVEGHQCESKQLTLPQTPILVRLLLRTPKVHQRTFLPPTMEPEASQIADQQVS